MTEWGCAFIFTLVPEQEIALPPRALAVNATLICKAEKTSPPLSPQLLIREMTASETDRT